MEILHYFVTFLYGQMYKAILFEMIDISPDMREKTNHLMIERGKNYWLGKSVM